MGNLNTSTISQQHSQHQQQVVVQKPIISLSGCQQCLQQTRSQLDNEIQIIRQYQQIPFAQPIQNNINPYAPRQQHKPIITKIIQSQPIKLSEQYSLLFKSSNCMQLDQKYWKKQIPNVVISGTWDNHYPHGLITIYFHNHFIFISYFNHGQSIYDDCLLIYPDMSYYHGTIKNGKFHKIGKYKSEDFQYNGQWKDGLPHGEGVEKFIKYNVQYKGEFNNGQKQGLNSVYKVMNQSGQELYRYEGQFKNNDFYQQGKIYLSSSQNTNNNTIIKTDFTSYYPLVQFKQIKSQQYRLLNTIIQRDMSYGSTKIIQSKSKYGSSFKQKPVNEYSAELVNGKINGKCLSVVNGQNKKQQVYWFNGYKLKIYNNFNVDNQKQTQVLLNKIQNYYKQAQKYSEIVERLNKQYAYKYKFKIVKEKDINQIIKEKTNDKKKQILVELTQGKYVYVYTE